MNSTRIGVGLLCLLALTGVAVGQSAAFTFTTTAGEAQPGGEVAVTFTYENTGNSTDTAIVNVTSIPDGWEIVDRSDDAGTWNSGDQTWLYIAVAPGSSVSPSLTLSVPSDADGTYNVTALGSDDSETVQSNVSFEFGTAGESTETDSEMTETEEMTTDTMTEETASPVAESTASPVTESTEETTTGGSGPGFGVVVAGVALLAAALVALRRPC